MVSAHLKQDTEGENTSQTSKSNHNVKNALQPILNAVYIMKKSSDPEKTQEMLLLIENSVQKAIKILNDSQNKPQIQTIKIKEFIQEIVDQLWTENIEFVLDSNNNDVMYFDPIKMQQVLDNLIKNAVEAMPDGGKITITTSENTIWVSDDGPGISEEVKERLFREKTTTKEKGWGIGLISCQEIVKAHDGTITVDSKLGQGTIFTISLPSHTQNPS